MAEKIEPITVKLTGKLAKSFHEAAAAAGVKSRTHVLNVLSDVVQDKPAPKVGRKSSIIQDQLPSNRGRAPHPNCDCTRLCQLAKE